MNSSAWLTVFVATSILNVQLSIFSVSVVIFVRGQIISYKSVFTYCVFSYNFFLLTIRTFHSHTNTGHDTDYLNLALRDGGVSLTMGLANGKQEMHIKPARVRFDDHQWHKVTVHRRIQEVCTIH